MAVTPYKDLTTQDILSAHISGLSHSIKKIEQVLDMKTANSTFTLLPVIDQEEVSLRYRIYEGQHRNWTTFTLKRNGQTVDSQEYVAQPEFGAIVFHSPQTQTDEITVSATYITSGSNKISSIDTKVSDLASSVSSQGDDISSIESNVSTLQSSIATHTSEISTLKTDVQSLKQNSGGGGNDSSQSTGITFPLKQYDRTLFTNIRPDKTLDDLTTPSTNILMAGGKADAIPMVVEKRTKISKLQMYGGAGTAGGNAIMGIYGDSATMPSDLIGQTAMFSMGSGSIVKDLTNPVWLEPGLYWIVRWGVNQIRIDGYAYQANAHITFEPVSSNLMDGSGPIIGVRSAVINLSSLPSEFPPVGSGGSDSKYLSIEFIGTVYALR